jgi:hypothetical protein
MKSDNGLGLRMKAPSHPGKPSKKPLRRGRKAP